MGVPALFRWLTQKYPKITTSVVEEQPLVINGHKIPVDISKTNPNGMEFDNLYLDMNGIIHPCCHPEDKPAPATEDEMMIAIFEYIDRIMGMIRPRKLLYMAIDGVAPRAKMNQQRSRRFRAALEVIEKQEKEEEIQADLEDRGQPADGTDGNDKPEPFDSNCITPGTPFMSNLAVALRYYISERLNSDPGWKHLKVLMSDASVPGEGEHKIMDYIRRQRVSPDYDANTRHVLYGLDADLIMLALATHEPHFKILREDVFFQERNKRNNNNNNSNPRHQGRHDDKVQQMLDQYQDPHQTKPFIFLHVNILREYLEHELRYDNMPFPFDLERAIDDWVFLCFFVGNDFLPHLPSLEIREGAIDLLIELYKKNLDKVGGYLTEKGNVYLDRVQLLLTELGQVEDVIFQRRRMQEEKRQKDRVRRQLEDRLRRKGYEHWQVREMINTGNLPHGERLPDVLKTETQQSYNFESYAVSTKGLDMNASAVANRSIVAQRRQFRSGTGQDVNKSAAASLKAELLGGGKPKAQSPVEEPPSGQKRKPEQEVPAEAVIEPEIKAPKKKRKTNDGVAVDEAVEEESTQEIEETEEDDEKKEDDEEEEEEEAAEEDEETLTVADVPIPHKKEEKDEDSEPVDTIKLWESGWKERYYQQKFNVDADDAEFRKQIANAYIEGLCWVLKYYYQGCQSWQWYYPYHYSPFASDFMDIGSLNIEFQLGEPFKPLEQLMGVLPAASRKHIPEPLRKLMTDPESEIIDFYPERFHIDLNGKKHSWQGVVILPFIEEDRLLKAMEPVYPTLSEGDRKLNTKGREILYVGHHNKLFETFCKLYGKESDSLLPLDPKLSNHMTGFIMQDPAACPPGSLFRSPFPEFGLRDIKNNRSVSASFLHPDVSVSQFIRTLLPSVRMPPKQLGWNDIDFLKNPQRRRRPPHILAEERRDNQQRADRFVRGAIGQQRGRNSNDRNNNYQQNRQYNQYSSQYSQSQSQSYSNNQQHYQRHQNTQSYSAIGSVNQNLNLSFPPQMSQPGQGQGFPNPHMIPGMPQIPSIPGMPSFPVGMPQMNPYMMMQGGPGMTHPLPPRPNVSANGGGGNLAWNRNVQRGQNQGGSNQNRR